MASYKELHGHNIQTVSSDPDNPIHGQVWYNTTTGTIRAFQGTLAGTWATGGEVNSDGHFQTAGAGTQTAALVAGGGTQWPGVHQTGNTETYNGSAWSEVANLNTARRNLSGLGTQTAALAGGGGPTAKVIVESWNGSGWTEVGDFNTNKDNNCGMCGTTTAGIAFAGEGTPGAKIANAEQWNGSSWTEVGDLNIARHSLAAAGTSTATLGMGGSVDSPAAGDEVESYNGTSWTEIADLNTASREGIAGWGTQTAAIAAGGSTINVDQWNGTSWTEQNNLSISKSHMGPAQAGTTTAGLVTGGFYGPGIQVTKATEEWTGASDETITYESS